MLIFIHGVFTLTIFLMGFHSWFLIHYTILHHAYFWTAVYAFIIIIGLFAVADVASLACVFSPKCPFIRVMGKIGNLIRRKK